MAVTGQMADFRHWPVPCYASVMLVHAARLFTIKTKFEAFLVIYGLGTGAIERGVHYMAQYPGIGGKLLFAVCPLAVFVAGASILDSVERRAGR